MKIKITKADKNGNCRNNFFQQAFILLCVFCSFLEIATADFIRPANLVTSLGSVSSAPLSVLTIRDQSGVSNDPTKYLQFNPVNLRYSGFFRFSIPPALRTNLSSLALYANYRGPLKTTQTWSFRIKNITTGLWLPVLDNTNVTASSWTLLSKAISGSPASYMDGGGNVYIAYSTVASSASQLDYLSLETRGATTRWQPKIGLDWQIQFNGTINTSLPGVEAYDLDLFDTDAAVINSLHASGKRVICYFSAGSYENWRPDSGSFPAAILGQSLDGWPGERWLDIRQLGTLLPIMRARMQLAVSKKCDAVDPDNVDSYTYTNTGFGLTASHQLAYNKALATTAHSLGLSVSLKNDLEQINDLVSYFDFAINESCLQFNECNMLTPFVNAGKPVLGLEYDLNPSSFCPQVNALNFDFLKKNSTLDAARTACR